jgi:hypothetical protein
MKYIIVLLFALACYGKPIFLSTITKMRNDISLWKFDTNTIPSGGAFSLDICPDVECIYWKGSNTMRCHIDLINDKRIKTGWLVNALIIKFDEINEIESFPDTIDIMERIYYCLRSELNIKKLDESPQYDHEAGYEYIKMYGYRE